MIGRVLRDPKFAFEDGEEGNKRFVILGRTKQGNCVAARTTSKPNGRVKAPACSVGNDRPGHYIPRGGDPLFEVETWVCLNYLSDLDEHDLKRRVAKAEVDDLGEMGKKLFCEVLACAYKAEDTTNAQADAIRDTIAANCN